METLEKNTDPKIRLLANTVHEIRTPVQTIMSALELFSDTRLTHEQSEYLRQIQFSSDILLALTNDILDFAKIQSRQFKLESIPFDIIDLTEQISGLVSVEAFAKKLEIVTDIDYSLPRYFLGDPTRIQEVLMNLIKNAVKFTPAGYVHIELKRSGKSSGGLLFEITDTGIGIAEEKRRNIFTDFYQAESSTMRKYGGTGLGLAICKNLVSAMNGEIGMRENPNGGSVFWFTLHLAAADPPSARREEIFVSPKTHILVVDDSAVARKSMASKLAAIGLLNVEIAENAEQAFALLEDSEKNGRPFKIAFIDMIMPRVDGWQLASKINSRAELRELKCYLVVPEGQMGRDAKMKTMNWFTGYLYKPVKLGKLRTLLNETCNIPTDVEEIAGRPPPPPDDANIARGFTILIAEDHPVNRRLLAQTLKKYGAITYEAENGEDAVAQIKKQPDIPIVFMDIQMQNLDGVAATKKLREEKYDGIIIACTANSSESDFLQYKEAGMNDILVKPFKQKSVKALIEKWKPAVPLNENQPQQNLAAQTDLPLWDETNFSETIAQDNSFGVKLLNSYRNQTKILLSGIVQAITKNDFAELRRIGHTIEGSSAAISAYRLAENGRLLNMQAKAQNINGIKKAYNITRENFLQFVQAAFEWESTHG